MNVSEHNEAKQTFCSSKGPIFSLNPTQHPYLTILTRKCLEILVVVNNILQNVSRVYRLVEYTTSVNRIGQ